MAKKAKKAKTSKKKGGKKPKSIVKILLLLLIIAIVSGAGTCIWMLKKAKAPEPVENFVFGNNIVPSVTSVVGERNLSKVDSTEIQSQYDYKEVMDVQDDVKQYINYLINDCNFVVMDGTYDVEEPKFSAEGGTIVLATDTTKSGLIFQMDINYAEENYSFLLSTPEGSLPKKVITPFTRDDAYAFFDSKAEELGLPGGLSSYETVFDVGRTIIDGEDSYGVSVYKKEPADSVSNVIVGKFFISLDKSCIFKYDVENGVYIPVVRE